MRRLLLLLFIIGVKGEAITTGLTTTAGTELHKKIIGPIEDNGTKASRKRVAKFAKKYNVALEVNEEDVTNEANYVRPCKNLNNLECIRKFLAENSHCKPVRGPVDPLYLSQNTGFLSYTNITITFTNLTITGLDDAEVKEFYNNDKSCKVVLAIEVPSLKENTPEAFFTYHRKAKEDITLSDFETVEFKNIMFTTIMSLPKLRLDLAEIHAYLNEALPKFVIGPKAYTSTDPQVIFAFSELLKSVPILVQEYMLFQSQLLAAVYIQRNLCDFGLDLFSV